MKPGLIELTIEHLVLEGIDPRLQPLVVSAMQRELSRLISERGVPTQLLSSRGAQSLSANQLDQGGYRTPEKLGCDLAASVYESMGGLYEQR